MAAVESGGGYIQSNVGVMNIWKELGVGLFPIKDQKIGTPVVLRWQGFPPYMLERTCLPGCSSSQKLMYTSPFLRYVVYQRYYYLQKFYISRCLDRGI